MDPATHALAGFVLGRALFQKLTPYAVPLAVLGATISDIDYIHAEWHRKCAHSLVTAPFTALAVFFVVRAVAGAVGGKAARRPLPSWIWGPLAAFSGVLSHIFLDAINPWGVAWLWPISDTWFHRDFTRTGDPWLIIVFSMAIVIPFLSGLVSSEIGARRSSGQGAAIFALLAGVAYLGVRQQLHERAITVLESRVYDTRAPNRVAAVPETWNPLAWRGLVETSTAIREIPLNLLRQFDPEAGLVFYLPEASPAIEAVKDSQGYRSMAHHLEWPRWQLIPHDGYTEVRVDDLHIDWAMTFDVDPTGRILNVSYPPPQRR